MTYRSIYYVSLEFITDFRRDGETLSVEKVKCQETTDLGLFSLDQMKSTKLRTENVPYVITLQSL